MELLRMKGWKMYTDGTYIKFQHRCGWREVASERSIGLIIQDVINHVC